MICTPETTFSPIIFRSGHVHSKEVHGLWLDTGLLLLAMGPRTNYLTALGLRFFIC